VNGEPELLRVRDVAAFLGVSLRTCYDLVARGTLPGVVRAGRRIFVRRRALELWLSGRDGPSALARGDGPAAQVGAGLSGGAP
jgi:excisionase family DNA binding protein